MKGTRGSIVRPSARCEQKYAALPSFPRSARQRTSRRPASRCKPGATQSVVGLRSHAERGNEEGEFWRPSICSATLFGTSPRPKERSMIHLLRIAGVGFFVLLTASLVGQEKSVRPGTNKPFEDPD